ncbi:MAG: cupin domain-containing protein [Silvibacterium sp.]|nr:cupin domain-containing protein [Silvibacterium sp.]
MISQPEPRSIAADEGSAYWFLNSLCTVKATTESTGGAWSLTHIVSPPREGTPYQLHHYEDEASYVLDGEVAFFCDGKKTVLGPGGYIFLPRRIPHGLRVEGDRPATMLILAMPGTGFVSLMQEASEPARERVLPEPQAPDVEKLTRICAKYGIEILGPLPE